MHDNLWTLLIIPVIVVVIGLIIEYWIIQPLRRAKFSLISNKPISRDWMSAIKKAVKEFRRCRGEAVFFLSKERIKVEQVHIEKGRATLTLAVMPKSSPLFYGSVSWMFNLMGIFPRMIGKYEVTIDRTGDILKIDSLPIEESGRYGEPFLGRVAQDSKPRPKGIFLKEVKKPITEVTHEGLKVRIEFVVENWGEATKIYPHVEYKVAEFRAGKYEGRVVQSPVSWEVDLQARSTTPIAFDAVFDAMTILLTKPPNKVKVKLYRKPRKRT
jgi:hypothetical protein